MPLVGIITDDGELVESEVVLDEARGEGVAYGYPLSFWLDALKERNIQGYSVTELVSETLRQGVIKRLFEYYDSPKSMWARLRGTWLHVGAAEAVLRNPDISQNGVIVEKRIISTLDGVTVSGQVDMYHRQSGRLFDLKSTRRVPSEPYESHLHQLGAYRWLITTAPPGDLKVNDIYVVYMTWDDIQIKQIDSGVRETWDDGSIIEVLRIGLDVLQEGDELSVVPPKLFCNKKLCPWCPVAGICESLPEGRIKL